MKSEYRLAIKKFGTKYVSKRSYELARKGLMSAFDDFERYSTPSDGWDAWIETRETTEWEEI